MIRVYSYPVLGKLNLFRGYSHEILNLILPPFQDVTFKGTEVENSLQLDFTSSMLRTVCSPLTLPDVCTLSTT